MGDAAAILHPLRPGMGFEIAFAVAIFTYKNNPLKAKINFKPVFSPITPPLPICSVTHATTYKTKTYPLTSKRGGASQTLS